MCSNGGSLGALNHAIVVDQFERLRQGDAWWFERSGVLDAATLLEVQSTLFVDVVKRNSNLKNVQDNYFFFKTSVGGKWVSWPKPPPAPLQRFEYLSLFPLS